jgi:16S rRNA pseudouridine516 synthase
MGEILEWDSAQGALVKQRMPFHAVRYNHKPKNMSTRLDRFISNNSALSRSEARALIHSGAVFLAGRQIREPATLVTENSTVFCAGQSILKRQNRYLMLNKPVSVVCSTRDGAHRTVLDLVEQPAGLHPVGRLDLDSTGLVLLTDDGDWSHAISAPRRSCGKVYLVSLAEPIGAQGLASLRQGVQLRNETKPTRPAIIEILDERQLRMTIYEGKYHQIKRMLAAVGNRVVALHREQIGSIRLDPDLVPGAYRPLCMVEISSV